MSNEIYNAPQAELANENDQANAKEFFIVSTRKLWIMGLVTMGIYLIFWNYYHWRNYRQSIDDQSIWPVPRAIFSLFFIGSLMKLISEAFENKTGEAWAYTKYVVIYIFVSLISWFTSLIGDDSQVFIIIDVLFLIFGTILFIYSVVPAQEKANKVCDDSAGLSNNKLTAANIIWIILFVLFWIAGLAGFYIGFTEGY